MKTKMTLEQLKALFPPYQPVYKSPDGLEEKIGKHSASKRGHRHNHNPARKPVSGVITPAEYRRKHKGAS